MRRFQMIVRNPVARRLCALGCACRLRHQEQRAQQRRRSRAQRRHARLAAGLYRQCRRPRLLRYRFLGDPPDGQATLNRQAQWLAKYPNYPITIEGHADERGTREYNLALGERRAAAVRDYLASKGIPKSRIRSSRMARNARSPSATIPPAGRRTVVRSRIWAARAADALRKHHLKGMKAANGPPLSLAQTNFGRSRAAHLKQATRPAWRHFSREKGGRNPMTRHNEELAFGLAVLPFLVGGQAALASNHPDAMTLRGSPAPECRSAPAPIPGVRGPAGSPPSRRPGR